MQLWQYCLLVTARSLYMFRTLSASETCRIILQLLINNTAKVASFWFFTQYRLMMHGNSNIKKIRYLTIVTVYSAKRGLATIFALSSLHGYEWGVIKARWLEVKKTQTLLICEVSNTELWLTDNWGVYFERSGKRNFFIIKPNRCTSFTNLFWPETLHVSDSSSVHH